MMNVNLKYKSRKGFPSVDTSHLIDNSKIFKRTQYEKYDSSVYEYLDESGEVVYIGKGKFDWSDIYKARAFNHRGDLLSSCWNEKWTIRIIATGISDSEARALEAHLIRQSGKKLTRRGATKWDQVSLINKRRERKWEKQSNTYLLYGNNTRIAA